MVLTPRIVFLLPLFNVLAATRAHNGKGIFGAHVPSPFLSPRRRPRQCRAVSELCDPASARTATARTATAVGVATVLTNLRGGGSENIQHIVSLSQVQDILDTAGRNSDNQLVVLDFTSNNCPPCDMIAPIYTDLSQLDEFQRVVFCKVNVSDHPEVAERYGVDGWPTFVLFKDGTVVDRVVGGQAAKSGLYGLVAKHA